MDVKRMRCSFLYSLPMHRELVYEGHSRLAVGVTLEDVDQFRQRFSVEEANVPAFYTRHYRMTHMPYNVVERRYPQATTIPLERLGLHPFFEPLDIASDPEVTWQLSLSLGTVGLLNLCVEVNHPRSSAELYRISGLHLNAGFDVISTAPIQYLWNGELPPEYVGIDELARQIHTYTFQSIGMKPFRLRTLHHEIQIPVTMLEVETELQGQDAFIAHEAENLAEFVFKPACWEVEKTSPSQVDHILHPDRLWTVSEDSFAILAYEGILYTTILNDGQPQRHQVSDYWLSDTDTVLHSLAFAVSNYHLLRIVDDLLDGDLMRLQAELPRYQSGLQQLFQTPPDDLGLALLSKINDYIVEVSDLQFRLLDLIADIDNMDKLIDEGWHLQLFSKLNGVLGLRTWRESIIQRTQNLKELVDTLEARYHSYLNLMISESAAASNARMVHLIEHSHRAEERLQWLNYLLGLLGISELIGLIIGVGLDDTNPLSLRVQGWLDTSPTISHLISVAGVLTFFILSALVVIWLVNTTPLGFRHRHNRDS